ncbi:transglutaminase family protein [Paenibacillus sepulcri]|uniref:Transglutaminase family protein n=1 Tax=Paenibacillus sepulcri TaxID=359917 RepID=A0ABS7C4H5_9BACL|nr:transglutaminase family protein [Paenibacillus sepulcri]
MQLIAESPYLSHYVEESEEVDYHHPEIERLVSKLHANGDEDEYSRIRTAYEFVRDEVSHSWDIQSSRITRKASEVLFHREGICYAKSNLLAALLRLQGIPAGFCYQKLTIGDTPETGYCIHALNGVYLTAQQRWIRLDARGNKAGVHAAFSITEEKLAFPVRAEYGEEDYPFLFAVPNRKTMDALKRNTDCLRMYLYDLPVEL